LLRYGYLSIFRNGDHRRLGFLKFRNFNGWAGQEGRNSSPNQILWRSVKPSHDMAIFFIFLDGGHRHVGFLKCQNFNGWRVQEGQTASSINEKTFPKKLKKFKNVTKINKNSSGDEIANVNFCAVRPEATQIR